MLVLKNFNNISEQLREECIKPLNAGEMVTFKMLNGVVNNDPDVTERMKLPVLYPNTQIRTYDRIKDPYLNGKGGFVDIGVPESVDLASDKPTKFKFVTRGHGIGLFTLSGDSIEDVELYEFLCIANENADFKYRDKKVFPLFEQVKEVNGDEKEQQDFDMVIKAGAALKKLNIDQKRKFAVLIQINPNLDERALTKDLQKFIQSFPEAATQAFAELDSNTATRKGRKKRESQLV